MLRPTGGWGYNSDTEILFPMRAAQPLRSMRGSAWRALVERVLGTQDGSLERLAFSLLIVRLGGCLTCHADSFRAMRGCSLCAQLTIRRFRGDDAELIALYESAAQEVTKLLRKAEETGTTGD